MELLRGDRPVVRVGHRGAAALAPENSLEAIEAGAANGADVVELDVVRGAGGALVLAHGPHVPAGAAGLEDALSLVASTGIAVQLDVKTDGLAVDAVAALARHGLLGRSFVSSYSLPILRGFAAAAPELPRMLYEQLVERGRLVVPVGRRRSQELQLVVRTPEGPAMVRSVPCRFVPLVGEEGFGG
jgi:hypothetical protein